MVLSLMFIYKTSVQGVPFPKISCLESEKQEVFWKGVEEPSVLLQFGITHSPWLHCGASHYSSVVSCACLNILRLIVWLGLYGRVLAAVEENSKTEQANFEKLESDVRNLQQELDRLHREKLSLHKDVATTQQQLRGRRPGGQETRLFPAARCFCSLSVFLVLEVTPDWHGVYFRSDKNVLKLDCGVVCATPRICLKPLNRILETGESTACGFCLNRAT